MSEILLEEKHCLEFVRDMINESIFDRQKVNDAMYHHNTRYSDAASICKNGIMSIVDLNKTGIKKYSDEMINLLGDTSSHINGNDAVSLSVVGLDDLYPDEFEYDPLRSSVVDFLVSSKLNTDRSSINYGNEFLYHGSIKNSDIRSADIRLLRYAQECSEKRDQINELIVKYNYLIDIALEIKRIKDFEMLLREMSSESNNLLDVEKLSKSEKVIIKQM